MAEQAQLIQSTLPPEKAAALQALVATVVEELGGEEAIADYEVDTEAPAEAEAATGSEGSDDLTRIQGVGPEASAALVGAGIVRYSQLASTSEPDSRRILADADVTAPDNVSTWAMQAAFAANGDWPGLDAYLRASQPATATPGSGAGAGSDDLTQLSGVGPKAAEALAKAGIATYASLAEANEPQVRHALHESDMTPPAGVGTWPMQASFAARGDWQGLQRYNQKRTRATPAKTSAPAPSRGHGDAGRPDADQGHRAARGIAAGGLRHRDLCGPRAREHAAAAGDRGARRHPPAGHARQLARPGGLCHEGRLARPRDVQPATQLSGAKTGRSIDLVRAAQG